MDHLQNGKFEQLDSQQTRHWQSHVYTPQKTGKGTRVLLAAQSQIKRARAPRPVQFFTIIEVFSGQTMSERPATPIVTAEPKRAMAFQTGITSLPLVELLAGTTTSTTIIGLAAFVG